MSVFWGNGTKKKPRVSSKYGKRSGGAFSFHYGTDFTGYSKLKAIMAGTVTMAGWMNNKAGNVIVIDTKLPDGRTVTICRFHVAKIAVKRGQKVSAGQYIGTMGRTGNATGNCDHVEIRFWSGGTMTTVDPETWLPAYLSGSAKAPAYPLGAGSYFGPRYPLSNKNSVSGYHGSRRHLKRWQQRMKDRGWHITVDGLYGNQTRNIARAFQQEKGLVVDGLIGPATWTAAWTAPIT